MGGGPFRRHDERGRRVGPTVQIGHEFCRLAHGRGEPDGLNAGRQASQAREIERQEVAALRHHERVQLVENDALQVGEQGLGIGAGEQKRDLLGRRQQDVGRVPPLALALRGRRVARAGLDADVESHLGHGVSRLRATSTDSAFRGEM